MGGQRTSRLLFRGAAEGSKRLLSGSPRITEQCERTEVSGGLRALSSWNRPANDRVTKTKAAATRTASEWVTKFARRRSRGGLDGSCVDGSPRTIGGPDAAGCGGEWLRRALSRGDRGGMIERD